MTPVERYYPPKQLAAELCERHGLCIQVNYICAIRRVSVRDKDGTFIAGCARPSEVVAWLRAHPDFRRRDCLIAA
ncbi:MAG: hypothetical protein V4637_07360 [Pseudomonadota bacterium]